MKHAVQVDEPPAEFFTVTSILPVVLPVDTLNVIVDVVCDETETVAVADDPLDAANVTVSAPSKVPLSVGAEQPCGGAGQLVDFFCVKGLAVVGEEMAGIAGALDENVPVVTFWEVTPLNEAAEATPARNNAPTHSPTNAPERRLVCRVGRSQLLITPPGSRRLRL